MFSKQSDFAAIQPKRHHRLARSRDSFKLPIESGLLFRSDCADSRGLKKFSHQNRKLICFKSKKLVQMETKESRKEADRRSRVLHMVSVKPSAV